MLVVDTSLAAGVSYRVITFLFFVEGVAMEQETSVVAVPIIFPCMSQGAACRCFLRPLLPSAGRARGARIALALQIP